MPRKLDDPSHKSLADLMDSPNPEDQTRLKQLTETAYKRFASFGNDVEDSVCRVVADFDLSNPRSLAKLAGTMSLHYRGEPLSDWCQLPIPELLGYLDAISDCDALRQDETTRYQGSTPEDTPDSDAGDPAIENANDICSEVSRATAILSESESILLNAIYSSKFGMTYRELAGISEAYRDGGIAVESAARTKVSRIRRALKKNGILLEITQARMSGPLIIQKKA